MNAAFIAAFLILGTLTHDAMASQKDSIEDMCIYNECNNNTDCGPSDDCVCMEPRGDDYRKFCFKSY
uniref:Putative ixodegrin protein n=1 Tax=Ixodes ricinus TaxID=34613 RepID=A0A0K8RFL1_IXORI